MRFIVHASWISFTAMILKRQKNHYKSETAQGLWRIGQPCKTFQVVRRLYRSTHDINTNAVTPSLGSSMWTPSGQTRPLQQFLIPLVRIL